MRLDSNVGSQIAGYQSDDAGEGLAIFFSQNSEDIGRWRLQVQARTAQGVIQVGEIYVSPPVSAFPNTNLSRMVGGAVCPGAVTWSVNVSCIGTPNKPSEVETPEIILTSSKCFSAPIGLSRVGERYAYSADSTPGATQVFTVLPGMKITGIAAVALAGGGTVIIGAGDTITIPAGNSINLSPESVISPNTLIAFDNVDWVIEYLESA